LHKPAKKGKIQRVRYPASADPEFSLTMRWNWLRLIAWVGLGVFLANTPAGARLFSILLIGDESRPHVCGEQHSPAVETQAEHGRVPCGPDCPDCPKSPFAPKCPCPGGCALCNVAKVPCHIPSYDFTCAAASCQGAGVPELTSFYTPPAAGRLIRPPRV
jgi:hypothetical protein